MFLTWYVHEHDQDQGVLVTEGEVERVGQLVAPQLLLGHFPLGRIDAEQLAGDADRVEDYEGGVTGKETKIQTGRKRHG